MMLIYFKCIWTEARIFSYFPVLKKFDDLFGYILITSKRDSIYASSESHRHLSASSMYCKAFFSAIPERWVCLVFFLFGFQWIKIRIYPLLTLYKVIMNLPPFFFLNIDYYHISDKKSHHDGGDEARLLKYLKFYCMGVLVAFSFQEYINNPLLFNPLRI